MSYRLDPAVLDAARQRGRFTSDEKLAVSIGMSGSAVRNLRSGASSPSLATLVKLQAASGWPLDSMVIRLAESAA